MILCNLPICLARVWKCRLDERRKVAVSYFTLLLQWCSLVLLFVGKDDILEIEVILRE